MKTTLETKVPPYIGVDLTSRYRRTRPGPGRPVDVCGLRPGEKGLEPVFWQWLWDAPRGPMEISPIAEELRQARVALLDGPQSLATEGESARCCDKECRTQARMGDRLPDIERPFGGYLLSSVELFTMLVLDGIALGPPWPAAGLAIGEIYPGYAWQQLGDFEKKTRREGREQRRSALIELGVRLNPRRPYSHDQLDAAIAALLAAAGDGAADGLEAVALGEQVHPSSEGPLREGCIIAFDPESPKLISLRERLAMLAKRSPAQSALPPRRLFEADDHALVRASHLQDWFVERLHDGHPVVVSYTAAWSYLIGATEERGAPSNQTQAKEVVALAPYLPSAPSAALGQVRLDTFIVQKTTWRPGESHWPDEPSEADPWVPPYRFKAWLAQFDRGRTTRVGNADVLSRVVQGS